MTAEQMFDRIGLLLEDERLAIRRLDGDGVRRIAEEKADLFLAIRDAVREDESHAGAFRELAGALRRNAVLLAHARDCLRDVLAAVHEPAPATAYSAPLAGSRLSVRG